jgi:hypothetical protein
MRSESETRKLIANMSAELDEWMRGIDDMSEEDAAYSRGMANRLDGEISMLRWVLGDIDDIYSGGRSE